MMNMTLEIYTDIKGTTMNCYLFVLLADKYDQFKTAKVIG